MNISFLGIVKIGPDVLIEVSEDGFAVNGRSIKWSCVNRVVGFKRDELVVDVICLNIEFQVGGAAATLELNEELTGFDEFCEAMLENLSNADREWWSRVSPVPFETNAVIVYQADEKPLASIPPEVAGV